MNPAQLLAHFDRISEAPDAIPRLRRFILDLAVRGKLVEQDPNDEPAGELMKRIIEKKVTRNLEKKVKTGKIYLANKPLENRSPLPIGWVWSELAELTAVLNGRAYSKNELLDYGTPVLRVGNLFTSEHWYYSNLKLGDDKYCDAGDLLFAWSASFGPFIWTGPKVIYHYHIWKLSLHSEDDLDKQYFYRFLLYKTREIKDAGHGVSMLHMTKEKMEKVLVPLPPLAEQHRIVAKVDELMALCDQLEAAKTERESQRDRLIAASLHHLNLSADADASREHARFYLNHLPRLTTRPEHIKQLRQTILNLAVRGRLVPQDPNDEPAAELLKRIQEEKKLLIKKGIINKAKQIEAIDHNEIPYRLPENWIWTCTETLCEVIVDCPHSTPIFISNGIICLDTNAFKAGSLIEKKIRYVSNETYQERVRRLVPRPGDIVFSREGSVGESVIIPKGMKCCLGQRVMLFRPMSDILSTYFSLALSEPSSLARLLALHKGIGAKHVNVADMRKALLPVPPLPEQHRIVAKVDELMALCDQLEAQLTTTQANSRRLLEAMLHRALGEHI